MFLSYNGVNFQANQPPPAVGGNSGGTQASAAANRSRERRDAPASSRSAQTPIAHMPVSMKFWSALWELALVALTTVSGCSNDGQQNSLKVGLPLKLRPVPMSAP